jgi:hypothetical protein
MTAKEHNQTLATLHFIYGAMHGLTLVALLLLIFIAKLATPLAELITTSTIVVGMIVFLILLLIVGVLPLLVGYGLRKRSRWVKSLALALALISLINIPIGTALGIYTFKFFKSEGGVRLYGGKGSAASEPELQAALTGAQPLMDLAKRVKQ